MTNADSGQTPDAPDVDEPEGGAHGDAGDDSGRTPSAPDVDQPEGGAHAGNAD